MARTTTLAAALLLLAGAGDAAKWQAKRKELLQQTSASPSRVVRLTSSNYTKFVMDSPRDYDVIVFYTAAEAKYGCSTCGALAKEVRIAAQSYETIFPSALAAPGEGEDAALPPRDVFFAVVDFKHNQEAFAMHAFKSVPHVALHERTQGSGSPPASEKRVEKLSHAPIPASRLKSPTDATLSATDIMSMLPEPYRVNVVRPAEERFGLAVAAVLLLAALASLAAYDLNHVLFFMNGTFWCVACVAVFAVGVSGAISCVIKASPLYGHNKAGGIVLFSGGGGHHDQYYAEGAVIGALNLAAAGGVIALVNASKSSRMSAFSKAVLGSMAIAVFIVAYSRIFGFYQDKTSWYKLESLVPGHMRNTLWAAYNQWLAKPVGKAYADHLAVHVTSVMQHAVVQTLREAAVGALYGGSK